MSYDNDLIRDASTFNSSDYDPDDLETDYYRDLHEFQERLDAVNAHRALQYWVPALAAFGAVVITAMMLFKGLKNINIDLSTSEKAAIMAMVAAAVWLAVNTFARQLKGKKLEKSTFQVFSWMQVFTAAAFAFSHGSNDIANAIGPFVAVLDVVKTGEIVEKGAVPVAILLAMGIALVAGLWYICRNVIKTVGSGLTEIHPANGFAAASVVIGSSLLGLPVSSTHILIGAVLGVGLVNGHANWKLMKPISMAWVITLPVSAVLAAVTVAALRVVF